MESRVQLISIPLKQGDNMEKLRRKVLRTIQKNERGILQANNIKMVDGIDPSMIKTVVTNSQYIVFLLNDGRVCRISCNSHSRLTEHHISHEISRQARDTSFQVLSDAEYARQLQAQFDQEQPANSSRSLSSSNAIASMGSNDISPYVSLSYMPSLNSNFSYSPSSSSPVYIPQFSRSDSSEPNKEGGASSDGTNPSGGGPSNSTETGSDKKSKKDKEAIWPNMGSIEWPIVKQVHYTVYNNTINVNLLLFDGETCTLYVYMSCTYMYTCA